MKVHELILMLNSATVAMVAHGAAANDIEIKIRDASAGTAHNIEGLTTVFADSGMPNLGIEQGVLITFNS